MADDRLEPALEQTVRKCVKEEYLICKEVDTEFRIFLKEREI